MVQGKAKVPGALERLALWGLWDSHPSSGVVQRGGIQAQLPPCSCLSYCARATAISSFLPFCRPAEYSPLLIAYQELGLVSWEEKEETGVLEEAYPSHIQEMASMEVAVPTTRLSLLPPGSCCFLWLPQVFLVLRCSRDPIASDMWLFCIGSEPSRH